jgi:hypothetical protein
MSPAGVAARPDAAEPPPGGTAAGVATTAVAARSSGGGEGASTASAGGTVAPVTAAPVAVAAAVAAAAGATPSAPSGVSADALSYSPTEPKAGRPADAASARVAASPATIARRRPRVCASRARSRKLIRDVASREPYGTTSARRFSSVERIRAAADVISSSTSR